MHQASEDYFHMGSMRRGTGGNIHAICMQWAAGICTRLKKVTSVDPADTNRASVSSWNSDYQTVDASSAIWFVLRTVDLLII